ncbi:MAG: heat-inducible transcriptional repressor HrcA [Chlamydiota bacterium]|nr:heat-inducible transcriptional repressor HrcA [Chlamydiota bacterium]
MESKQQQRAQREERLLFAIVERYINTSTPVGSHTLCEEGIINMSSATIRGHLNNLEKEGWLTQPHPSGGRIPSLPAIRKCAHHWIKEATADTSLSDAIQPHLVDNRKEIASYLTQANASLARISQGSAFLISPRFDHDRIVTIRIVPIDCERALCVLITDFGLIHTDILPLPKKMGKLSLKRLETDFNDQLRGSKREIDAISRSLYNEVVIRHMVRYANFEEQDIDTTGCSHLLNHACFQDPSLLLQTFSLLENHRQLRVILKECIKQKKMTCWIGEKEYGGSHTTIITTPYSIHNHIAGAVGLIVPLCSDYRSLFALMRSFAKGISDQLTRTLQTYQISYRQPPTFPLPYYPSEGQEAIQQQLLKISHHLPNRGAS